MKIFLQFVLPILLPGLLFILWTVLTRVRPGQNGSKRSIIAAGPWFGLILAGFILMAIGLIFTSIYGGMDPDGIYRAPYWEDGKVVPGGMTGKP